MLRRSTTLVGGALVVAAALAAGLVFASRSGSGSDARSTGLAGVADTEALLRGIPKQGTVLGSPAAPVTLVEYADLQCPICAEWANRALPTIVRRYVRPGNVRLVFRGLAFLGPDSETALRTALAAAPAGKLWHVVELLYRNQGAENAGWVTDRLVRAVLAAAGADSGAVLAARSGEAVSGAIAAAARQASADGVPGTPTFMLGRTGRPLEPVRLTTLDPSQLSASIDAVLAR